MAKKNLRKTGQKILILVVLLFLKEGYLLLKNLFGLIYHPFITLRRVKKEADLSQTLLIPLTILLPTTTIAGLSFSSWLVFKLIGLKIAYPQKPVLILNFFSILFSFLIIFYLIYWSGQVIIKNHFNKNVS